MVDSAVSLLAELALTATAIFVGRFAVNSFCECRSSYHVFKKLEQAQTVPITTALLHSLHCPDNTLVVLRGSVQPSLGHATLVHQGSGKDCVLLHETRGDIICGSEQKLRDTFALRKALPFALLESCQYHTTTKMETVPFVLTENSASVSVCLDASTHSLPLTRVFHQLQGFHAYLGSSTPYTQLNHYFKPVGLIEQMILPTGKEITAVGFCTLQHGNPQIVACRNFPYFLSDMTRDEMLSHLDGTWRSWCFCTIVLGSFSVGIFGYIFSRQCKRRRERSTKNDVADVNDGDGETAAKTASFPMDS